MIVSRRLNHPYRGNHQGIYGYSWYKQPPKDPNKPLMHLSQSIALKAFSKKPTTWTLQEVVKEPNLDFWVGYWDNELRMKNVVKETSRYIVFRMKDHIYFAGGVIFANKNEYKKIENDKSCSFDKYNLNEHRWVKCEHSCPYPLEHTSVVVSSDQTCAIFTEKNWKKRSKQGNRIIVFEEETGFTLLEDKMLRRSSNYVSIIVSV